MGCLPFPNQFCHLFCWLSPWESQELLARDASYCLIADCLVLDQDTVALQETDMPGSDPVILLTGYAALSPMHHPIMVHYTDKRGGQCDQHLQADFPGAGRFLQPGKGSLEASIVLQHHTRLVQASHILHPRHVLRKQQSCENLLPIMTYQLTYCSFLAHQHSMPLNYPSDQAFSAWDFF